MKSFNCILVIVFMMCVIKSCDAEQSKSSVRNGKLLSLFSLVRFQNTACNGTNGRTGTCYTSQECTDRSGTASGSCADSFGVCCISTMVCGGQTSENCTYFEVNTPTVGSCQAQFCPMSGVCQLRLDFDTFSITGPSSSVASTTKLLGGAVAPSASNALPASQSSQCLTDTFTVSSGGIQPPTICGQNMGEHMYVEADPNCNTLSFNLGSVGAGTPIVANRAWRIKISQYMCNYGNLAPKGCTQYFYGSASQQVRTYNFMGGQHLANQNQNICVRRERGTCKLCWAATATTTDFMVSGADVTSSGSAGGDTCCNYGRNGVSNTGGYDCAVIPGRVQSKSSGQLSQNHYCGRRFGTVNNLMGASVCQLSGSYNLRFRSDGYEFTNTEAIKPDSGFQLTYNQITSCP